MNIDPKSETQKPDCPKCEGTGKYIVGDFNAHEVDCNCKATFWQESARLMDEYRKEGNEERAQGIVDCRILYNRFESALQSENQRLTEVEDCNKRTILSNIQERGELKAEIERLTKINDELVKACQLYMRIISDEGCIPDMEQIELTDKMQSALKKAKSKPLNHEQS